MWSLVVMWPFVVMWTSVVMVGPHHVLVTLPVIVIVHVVMLVQSLEEHDSGHGLIPSPTSGGGVTCRITARRSATAAAGGAAARASAARPAPHDCCTQLTDGGSDDSRLLYVQFKVKREQVRMRTDLLLLTFYPFISFCVPQ